MKGRASFASNLDTWDQVDDGQYVIYGSPDTVYEKLEQHLTRLGAGNLLGLFQLGNMPDGKARASMGRFAEQVMPRLDERFPDAAEPPPTQVAFPAAEAVAA